MYPWALDLSDVVGYFTGTELMSMSDTLKNTDRPVPNFEKHCDDVITGAMASQITSFTIVCSTVYSGADQRKYHSSASLACARGNSPRTGEFPAQMASNTENVSI